MYYIDYCLLYSLRSHINEDSWFHAAPSLNCFENTSQSPSGHIMSPNSCNFDRMQVARMFNAGSFVIETGM